MIELVDGKIYDIPEEELSQQILSEFAVKEHENDVLCIVGKNGNKKYYNVQDVRQQRFNGTCWEVLNEHVFYNLHKNSHIDGVVPLLDSHGKPMALAKMQPTSYTHVYDCDIKRINTDIFELYECIYFSELNEYSVLMYQQCLRYYRGKIVLGGTEWKSILPYLGKGPEHAEIVIVEDNKETEMEIGSRKVMGIYKFASNVAGWAERCANGVFSFDELMTLAYYFTVHGSFGKGNADKKFFLIDVKCNALGLAALLECFDVPCAFLITKGYTPIINLVSSADSLYSDGPEDDIWSKFFRQPYGGGVYLLKDAADITKSPMASVTFSGKWLMQKISHCGRLDLMRQKYFNDRLLQHIDGYRQRILQLPQKTLGVLIRGTDYLSVKPKGHAIQASPEQVMEKIREVQIEGWHFERIFVATEDEEALEKMQEAFGNMVSCVDQKRFRVNKGEYLYQQKEKADWHQGDGYKLGADYLCAMELLSECRYFIASGWCTGVEFAKKLSNGTWNKSYVFDLGVYE